MKHRRRRVLSESATPLHAAKSAEILADIRTALQQIEEGKCVSNEAAKAELRRRFRTVNVVAAEES